VDEEDLRRSHRERDRLVRERTAHINRIKGLLFAQGIRGINVKTKTRSCRSTSWSLEMEDHCRHGLVADTKPHVAPPCDHCAGKMHQRGQRRPALWGLCKSKMGWRDEPRAKRGTKPRAATLLFPVPDPERPQTRRLKDTGL
jgi:hypothetical protein